MAKDEIANARSISHHFMSSIKQGYKCRVVNMV